MKTLTKMKIAVTGILMLPSLVLAAGPSDVATSLQQQRLDQGQVADLFDSRARAQQPVTDLGYFAGLKVNPPPSSEGIPSVVSPNQQSGYDVMRDAYSSVDLIERALRERQTMPIGERLRFMTEQAGNIIAVSGERPTEILLRLTLNRSVDVFNHIRPIAGRNTESVARYLANFYRENFELAASFGNNKIGVDSRLTLPVEYTTADFLKHLSIAEYGRMYASLLWRYSADLTSDSAKAVLLMRLVNYLGWDCNADLRRRERPIAQTIADIYELQHGHLYNNLLRTLAAGYEPSSSDLAQFRRRVYTILERLPSRFQEAGIYKEKQ